MDFLTQLDPGTIATIITAVLGVLSVVFGTKYKKFKDITRLAVDILEDNEVTKEEAVKFAKKIKNW